MSRKFTQQFVDPKGILVQGSDGNGLVAEGTVVPTDGTAGYAPGCHFFKRDGSGITGYYVNGGTALSCLFEAAGTSPAGGASAAGVIALDGANPTPVVSGLTSIVAVTLSLLGVVSPGVGTSVLTVGNTNFATGGFNIYAWKVTSAADPTLVASTGTESVAWVAVGF